MDTVFHLLQCLRTLPYLRRLLCHHDWEWTRYVWPHEIEFLDGARCEWKCARCGLERFTNEYEVKPVRHQPPLLARSIQPLVALSCPSCFADHGLYLDHGCGGGA